MTETCVVEQAEMFMNRLIEHGIIRVIIPGYDWDAQLLWAELAHQAVLTNHPLRGVLDRGEVKKHGTQKRYEGYDIIPGRTVYI